MIGFIGWLAHTHNVFSVLIAFLLGLMMHDLVKVVFDDLVEPMVESAIQRENLLHEIRFRDILKKMVHFLLVLAIIYGLYLASASGRLDMIDYETGAAPLPKLFE